MDKNKVLKVILIWLQCFYLKTEVQWRELPIESYFEKGEINAIGTHNELLQSSELYQRMWNAHNRAQDWNI